MDNNDDEDGCMALPPDKPCDLLSGGSVPKLLKKSAGGEKCCIFRIPQRLEKNNENAYEPRVVSVGPYHHGKKHLEMIQEHKHRLLGFFMDEVQEKGVDPKDLIETVSKLEEDIRESYSESLYHGDDDLSGSKKLIDMMVLDGCFILMLFMVVAGEVRYNGVEDDPIFRVPWILPAIRSDLLLLENQVPFFLLQTIFERSKMVTSSGLNAITFNFFSYSIDKPDEFWLKRQKLEANHLLDLVRKIFMPILPQKQEEETDLPRPFLGLILSAKKLQLRGIKFKPRNNAETLLDIKLNKNVVEVPQMILDDFIISVFLNCVAYEQIYADSTNHITSYVAFMGCLLKHEDDAAFLNEKGIIENYFGSGVEVSQIFKVIGKDIVFHVSESYLAEVFEGVNEYTSRGCHVHLAGFVHTHFDTPWTCLSSCAALTLLILTVFQAFFAGFAYFRPPKDK
ncbi:unnamed protein product [Microthlaspi erraticum]|uniref:Uncharacterized protein n=1 Tax=Microthlaspi erraticum TaxID=1685480 RepID=A0A6D2IFB9_9BRAS|nr:unnamed protein product [Microthlaspi erraticum]